MGGSRESPIDKLGRIPQDLSSKNFNTIKTTPVVKQYKNTRNSNLTTYNLVTQCMGKTVQGSQFIICFE